MFLSKVDKFFGITNAKSTVKQEVLAGLTTFLTMSYIIFVNPAILSNAGMDQGSVFVATILAAAISCFIMGIYANWPLGLAPGMGTNAWFTYGVVLGMGYSWQQALGATFLSGLIMVILTILPIRKAIIDSIPHSIKMALAASVGLFIAFIGLKGSGIVVSNPATFVGLGDLTSPSVYLTGLGLVIIFICEAFKIRGSVIISILVLTVIALLMGTSSYQGIVSLPPSIAPTLFQLDIRGAIELGFIAIIISIFLIDFFNSTAVFVGVMGSVSDKIPEKNMKKALLSDGLGTTIGSLFGVNTITTYSENAVGVAQAGGRTGLVAVTIGVLFLLALVFFPVVKMIPSYATAPAMIYIASLMFSHIRKINWEDPTELFPAFLLVIVTPLTYSIFNGIGVACIAWIIMKIVNRQWESKHWPVSLIGIAFLAYVLI